MSLITAAVAVLAVGMAIQGLFTIGILRRLRTMQNRQTPSPGTEIRLDPGEDGQWPGEAHSLLTGTRLVVMLTRSCPACSAMLDDLCNGASLPVDAAVILSKDDATDDSWMTRLGVLASRGIATVTSPAPLEDLSGWSYPSAFPMVIGLRNGVVVHSGHRLRDGVSALTAVARPTRPT